MITVPMKVAVQSAIPVSVASVGGIPLSLGAEYKVGGEPYHGEYEFTPTEETQTVPTQDKFLSENIIIHPIPSNYGRIGWNGSILTVS